MSRRSGCRARQMDATAAFERFRASYAERVDAMFDRLMGGALDLAHDRAVARDLLALAPPGIDELYALVTLGELLAEGRYVDHRRSRADGASASPARNAGARALVDTPSDAAHARVQGGGRPR